MIKIGVIFENGLMDALVDASVNLLLDIPNSEITKIEWKRNFRTKYESKSTYDVVINLSNHTFNVNNYKEDNLVQIPYVNNLKKGISRELFDATIKKEDAFEVVSIKKYSGKQGLIIKKAEYPLCYHSYEKSNNTILSHLPYFIFESVRNYLLYPEIIKQIVWEDNHPRVISINNYKIILTFRKYLHYLKILFTYDSWKIGICNYSLVEVFKNKHLLNSCKYISTRSKRNFIADPFGFKSGSNEYIIFEKLKGINKKGVLQVRKINENKPMYQFELDKHLSYPFVFEDNNSIYIIPEQHKLNKVDLYKWDSSLEKLEFVKTLIENFLGVDNSIVKWQNKYWMFSTTSARKSSDINLHLFYADTLMGEWTPHKLNPIITSIKSSRPAGTIFTYGEKLYRPAQNSSKTYGGSITIFEVIELTTENYIEQAVEQILPEDIGNNSFIGIHTISKFGDKTLIDVKTRRFKIGKIHF
jgi:hypothetical protein